MMIYVISGNRETATHIHCNLRITFAPRSSFDHSGYNLFQVLCQSQTVDLFDQSIRWSDKEIRS